MGNCLVLHENMVKIVKTDGKVLEYKAPIRVYQVLTQFSGHAIVESLPVVRHLHPNTKLLRGQLYYLVLPEASPPPPKISKKKVRFANSEVESELEESSAVRIKLVISKKELQNMLCKGGISINSILPLVRGEKGEDAEDKTHDYGFQGWKPALESIPEVN